MLGCLILGDSIADGSAAALRAAMVDHCVVVTKVGASTEWAIRMSPPGSFRTAIISAGSNDVAIPGLRNRLERLRASVSAERVMWILPYSPVAAQLVRQVAQEHGDRWISLADLPSRRDRVHPVSYRPLASALVATGFAGGREVLPPADAATLSTPVRVQAARHAVLLAANPAGYMGIKP